MISKPLRSFVFVLVFLLTPSHPSAFAVPLVDALEEAETLPEIGEGPLVLNLQMCIEMALLRNSKIRAGDYDIEAAEYQRNETKALFWPVLEYRYRMAPVPKNVDNALDHFFEGQIALFNSIHVGVGMPVATFGQLSMAKKLAEGGITAAHLNQERDRGTTIMQVKQLYFGIQLAHELRRLVEGAIDEIGKKVVEEEAKELSDMSPMDIVKLKLFRTELEKRMAEIGQNQELAKEGLRVQTSLPAGTPFELKGTNLYPVWINLSSFDAYLEASRTHRPEFQLVDVGVATKERLYELEKRKLRPKAGLGFFVEVGRTTQSISGVTATDDFNNPFNYSRAGLGLQLEGTIDFHGAFARIKKARAEYFKASLERMIAKRGLSLECQKFYENAKRAQDNVGQAKKAQSLAQQMLFLAKTNMDIGLGESKDFADALQSVLLTRGQYFQNVFEYNIALAELERIVGQAAYGELTPALTEDPFKSSDDQVFDEGAFEKEGQ